ncbi:hypothetical protein J6590_081933 [Homalodisca vitripennis]|nr:hypothetical protein J6590_081933 [Homalodisca vitripennis]
MRPSQILVCLIHFCIMVHILGQNTTLVLSMPQCLTQNDCPDVLTCIDMKCVDPCPGPCAQNSSCRVHKHVPFCSCSPGQILQTKCLENADCPLDRACIKQKCEDPCYNICNGNNTSCRVRNHIPYCTCKQGFYGDPLTACNQQYLSGSWPPFPGAKKRYEVETVKANWYGAMVHCMKHGGRLATISSFEENEIVKSKINKSGYLTDMSYLWHQATIMGVRDEPRAGQHVDIDKHWEIPHIGLYVILISVPSLNSQFWVSRINLALAITWARDKFPVLDVRDEPRAGQNVDMDEYEEILHIFLSLIMMSISGQKPQFWTSGMNYPLTETWTWMSTGQPLTYTDWTVGQPDSWLNLVVGEHCLELWEPGHYRWNDRNCLDILYFICEYYD